MFGEGEGDPNGPEGIEDEFELELELEDEDSEIDLSRLFLGEGEGDVDPNGPVEIILVSDSDDEDFEYDLSQLFLRMFLEQNDLDLPIMLEVPDSSNLSEEDQVYYSSSNETVDEVQSELLDEYGPVAVSIVASEEDLTHNSSSDTDNADVVQAEYLELESEIDFSDHSDDYGPFTPHPSEKDLVHHSVSNDKVNVVQSELTHDEYVPASLSNAASEEDLIHSSSSDTDENANVIQAEYLDFESEIDYSDPSADYGPYTPNPSEKDLVHHSSSDYIADEVQPELVEEYGLQASVSNASEDLAHGSSLDDNADEDQAEIDDHSNEPCTASPSGDLVECHLSSSDGILDEVQVKLIEPEVDCKSDEYGPASVSNEDEDLNDNFSECNIVFEADPDMVHSDSVIDCESDKYEADSDNYAVLVPKSQSDDSYSEKVGVFRLAHMNLFSLPSLSVESERLTNIDLSFNKLEEIPSFFLQNNFNNVVVFNVSSNLIKNIPDEFAASFPKLGCLDISNNMIETLPLSLRNCELINFKCAQNKFHIALQGIFGRISGKNNDHTSRHSALNMRYFFGLVSFYLTLDDSSFQLKTQSLSNWSEQGNYKAEIFLKLAEVYRQKDQTDEVNADEEGDNYCLQQMRIKYAHQRFLKIVPVEAAKFHLFPSMESFDSFMCSISEESPQELPGTQAIKEYLDAINDKIQKDMIEAVKDKGPKVASGPEPKDERSTWTRIERYRFLCLIFTFGLTLCYFLIWPILTGILISPDGIELIRMEYLSHFIHPRWTWHFGELHASYHEWIMYNSPHFISEHLPLIDYRLPIWKVYFYLFLSVLVYLGFI